jgi:hypothetical protein
MNSQKLLRAPTTVHHIFDGMVTVYGFGVDRNCPDQDLQLRGIEESEHPEHTHGHVLQVFESIKGLKNIYSPSPNEFNSKVYPEEILESPVNCHVRFANKTLFRGIKADGIDNIQPHNAFAMSAADCALVVVECEGRVSAAHAGRNSLFDFEMIATGRMSRDKFHASVVDALMGKIPEEAHKKTRVFVGYAISPGPHFPHPMNHPQYGEQNKRLITWIAKNYILSHQDELFGDAFWVNGELDLRWIITRQFEQYGVSNFTYDDTCTFSDTDDRRNPLWYSQVRTPGKRNLIIAHRNR